MTEDIHINDLRNAFRAFVARERNTYQIPARMGRPDGGGLWTFDVPGANGLTYVRVFQGEGVTLTKARNVAGLAELDDLPIWLDRDKDGNLIIIATRWEGT